MTLLLLPALFAIFILPHEALARKKEKVPEPAKVEVRGWESGCSVDIDSGEATAVGESGVLVFHPVEAGDHYLHIQCTEGERDSRLISPSSGETVVITRDASGKAPAGDLSVAERHIQLREHIQNAVRLRARGKIDEAATHLHDARRIDPANSDLHRELGITFLLGKEWKRARIEMLEAIWCDPNDGEAFNGLGYALEKLGKLDAAVEAFHTASKLDPTNSGYRRQYINALGRQAEERALEQSK